MFDELFTLGCALPKILSFAAILIVPLAAADYIEERGEEASTLSMGVAAALAVVVVAVGFYILAYVNGMCI